MLAFAPMPKPEFQVFDIPEFERRSPSNPRQSRLVRSPQGPRPIDRGETERGVGLPRPAGRGPVLRVPAIRPPAQRPPAGPPTLRVLQPRQIAELPELRTRRPLPILGILIVLALAGTVASFIWWLNQPRPAVGVFATYQIADPVPALIPPPAFDRARVMHKTKRGETFERVTAELGIKKEDTAHIIEAVRALPAEYDIKKPFKPGRVLSFELSSAGDLEQFAWQPEASRELVLHRTKTGAFAAKVQSLRGVSREHVAVGTIESSFAAAAAQNGVGYEVVDELVDLFSNRIEFNKDFRPGDRFTVIYRMPVLRDGSPVGDPQILAAALEVKGEHLVAARYVGSDGKARYFDEKGNELGNSFLRYPLKFSRISSYFSNARFHPVLGVTRPHNGIDFAAPIGTPVRTVADGVVTAAGNKGPNGNMVKIKHNDRYSTAYLHLSSISREIRVGARVHRGEVIGAVGMTGLATGPHLHFSFYDNEKYVNPLTTLLPMLDSLEAGIKIEANYLKKVLFTLDHYQRVTLSRFYAGKAETDSE